MELLLLYFAFAVCGLGYLFMVLLHVWEGASNKWWEPWVMPLVYPPYLLYKHYSKISGAFAFTAVIGVVLWLSVLAGDLFQWIWSRL